MPELDDRYGITIPSTCSAWALAFTLLTLLWLCGVNV